MERLRALAALAALACASPAAASAPFTLASATFADGGTIPHSAVYNAAGCDGANISPELHWSNAPHDARSFVLVVFDPKAQGGTGWYHWLAFDIPAALQSLPAGAGDPRSGKTPREIVFGRNDYGAPAYGGPCPPQGDGPHPYQFTIYALRVAHVPGGSGTTGTAVGALLRGEIVAHATLTGYYGR
ncbi:MAG TPA: YbhB/YbcL family Raf kinase inhibitor-like protein [Candidatus Acidoferrum sp.]|jgi:Raf kinase inhibitor-like YbhB/YbcL family protein|nr:YbhB/YbcL family Raf kinase inhibitor-like protein [Candidatus Acidoferrum sp.]